MTLGRTLLLVSRPLHWKTSISSCFARGNASAIDEVVTWCQLSFQFIICNDYMKVEQNEFRGWNSAVRVNSIVVMPNCPADVYAAPTRSTTSKENQFFTGNQITISCLVSLYIIVNLFKNFWNLMDISGRKFGSIWRKYAPSNFSIQFGVAWNLIIHLFGTNLTILISFLV